MPNDALKIDLSFIDSPAIDEQGKEVIQLRTNKIQNRVKLIKSELLENGYCANKFLVYDLVLSLSIILRLSLSDVATSKTIIKENYS